MTLRRTLSRRALLTGLAAAFVASRTRPPWAHPSHDPFALGVASGHPGPDGAVLWTRLAPEPLSPDPERPGGMPPDIVPVDWEVAADPRMQQIVRHGTEPADPDFAHSVHVECNGLEPGREYWYRFMAGGEASPIGMLRTAPAPGAPLSRLRFGFASCANYELGYFSAYRHLAAENPDLVLFLGDYIYEYARHPPKVRDHSDGAEAADLRTYRNRHAQYKTDPDLRALHGSVACLATWDDHEVQNDYADDRAQTFDDPLAFLTRRAAAYQAFWEHMPLPLWARPRGPGMTIFGRHDFGGLATFLVLDGRQYRSPLACDGPPRGGARPLLDAECAERLDPRRSFLGKAQEAWLYREFRTAPARWTILAQPQLMAEFKERLPGGEISYWSDDWNGYPAARRRLLDQIAETRLANPVVLGGDIHSFWANELKPDFDDPQAAIVATEFITSSVTSKGPSHEQFAAWAADNPHVRFFDSRKRGYASAELSPERLEVAFRAVDDVRDPASGVSTLRRFVVENGHPGPQFA
ncbi:MAG: alkaline phosphatase [Alphaproteobacteria bacterium]